MREKHGRPVHGFGATLTGMNGEDGFVFVVGTGKIGGEFQAVELTDDRPVQGCDIGVKTAVFGCLGQFSQIGQAFEVFGNRG